ncbi:deaminase domain-containing protein, partial [Neobacillus vireti]|uniref:deaminase domain-containing protein n=1 Tax=Neobacillus vireti TaxID=220686 RepID=UPI002FFFD684
MPIQDIKKVNKNVPITNVYAEEAREMVTTVMNEAGKKFHGKGVNKEQNEVIILTQTGNQGAAVVKIQAEQKNYIAFSKLNFDDQLEILKGLGVSYQGYIITKPEEKYDTLKVNNKNEPGTGFGYKSRVNDTEKKMLEAIYWEIKADPNFIQPESGEIHIFTKIEPCKGCIHVTEQFLNDF